MKLYATTTSERASKGQGGNKYLDIQVMGENEKPIMLINFMFGIQPDMTEVCHYILTDYTTIPYTEKRKTFPMKWTTKGEKLKTATGYRVRPCIHGDTGCIYCPR